jgi:sporulation protein YlmC with PRC-barrel domain
VAAGRVVDLHLHLLDRQVVDRTGRLVCKVDDLQLEADETGRLLVTGILVGPRALGPRLGGRLGRWIVAIATRLADRRDREPHRIDMGLVTDIGSAVTIGCDRADLHVDPLEGWIDDHVIGRIPGSRHAGD